MKRATRSVLQADWSLFFLRWILLGSLVAYHFINNPQRPLGNTAALAAFGLFAVYDIIVALLLIAQAGINFIAPVTIVADSIFAIAVYWAMGWPPDIALWAAAFPALTAALRYHWLTGAFVAVIISAANIGQLYAFGQADQTRLLALLPEIALLLGGALLTGLLSEQIKIAAIKRTHAERDAEEKRIKHVREQARAIYDMASLVSVTTNYERVLDAALDRSTAVVSDTRGAASQMVSAALLFRDGMLRVATSRRFTNPDQKVSLAAKRGVLAEAINHGEAMLSAEPFRDPELGAVVALRACRTIMAIPLQSGLDTYGVMLFAHPRPDFFDLDHIELLEAICKHTIIALQNAKLYQKLVQEKERIVEVEEDARKKLARDLHDGPTQSVAAIAMRANYIRRLLERDPKNATKELYKVEELARRTTKEIRHMLFTLRPLVLETQGLGAALESLADKMKENYNLNVIVEAQPEAAEKLDVHAQGVLFYIAEEAVGNARKHAEAEHIWVRIKLIAPEICALEIHDDGVGFDVGAVTGSYETRGSLGMVNMRERTELVNGVLHLDSAPGRGTKITVLVPLTDEAREKLGA
ncbi:MAG: GAF domain-containing sensor histidine kinase [Chloroflexi bacterium]|nr:GAF domain-containing sensor histidine kinase [Chloroflexota bacterium]